jgi:hypothetical protein
VAAGEQCPSPAEAKQALSSLGSVELLAVIPNPRDQIARIG